MPRKGENYYQVCREMSGLTQETAAEKLGISTRSLARYEAVETDTFQAPPDEKVDAMAGLYKTPLLAWWHLKNSSPLGKYLPDVQMPTSFGDAGFQTVLGVENAAKAEAVFRKIMADGEITPDEHSDLEEFCSMAMVASSRLLSAKAYAKNHLQKGGSP